MTVQGPVKEQQPDGMSHRGVIRAKKNFVDLKWASHFEISIPNFIFPERRSFWFWVRGWFGGGGGGTAKGGYGHVPPLSLLCAVAC